MTFKLPNINIEKLSSILLLIAAAMFAVLVFTGSKIYSVQSGSMSPSLEKGHLLLLSKTAEENLRVGDIVTYINPENKSQTITHRIIETPTQSNEYKFTTKGDANAVADAPLASEYILGKQIFAVPYVGNVLDIVMSPIGLAALIYLPAALILFSELRKLQGYYQSLRPYYASEAIRRKLEGRDKQDKPGHAMRNFTLLTLFSVSILTAQVYAQPQTTHTVLTGNRISVAVQPDEAKPSPPAASDVSKECKNNVSVENNVQQTSRSGDAEVSDQNDGSSARSGDVSNESSTEMNISADCR